jgi:hypothetical protein
MSSALYLPFRSAMNAVVNSIVAPPKWSTAGTSWRWASSPARPVPQPGPAVPSAVSGGSEAASVGGAGLSNSTIGDVRTLGDASTDAVGSTAGLSCIAAGALGDVEATGETVDALDALVAQATPTIAAIVAMKAR